MACLSQEQLVRLVLQPAENAGLHAHVDECAECRAALQAIRSLTCQLAEVHAKLNEGHERSRERLLEILPPVACPPRVERQWRGLSRWIGGCTTRQRIALSGIGVAALLAFVLLWSDIVMNPVSAMEQMVAKLRQMKSFEVTFVSEGASQDPDEPGDGSMTVKEYWLAPGSVRTEGTSLFKSETMRFMSIFSAGKPGIRVNHKTKEFYREPSEQDNNPYGLQNWLDMLCQSHLRADRQLGAKEINGKAVHGYEIDRKKVNPDGFPGSMEIWLDGENLPVLIRWDERMGEGRIVTVRLEDFHWNIDLDPKLFAATPPEGYTDATAKPVPVEEEASQIVESLRTYSELGGGAYPHMNRVSLPVIWNRLHQLIGITGWTTPEQTRSEKYARIRAARPGFAKMHLISYGNRDAAYHGKTVRPTDKDKVLFRWKLDDGRYAVIFGDLHWETVSAQRLQDLEGR
jgi:outer membrane lipoprotein-sorting protein